MSSMVPCNDSKEEDEEAMGDDVGDKGNDGKLDDENTGDSCESLLL